MKKWKKIVLVICIILVMLVLMVAWRYHVLTKIAEKNQVSNSKTNYAYHSETEDMIMQCWKKDNIWKIQLKQITGEGNMTFWQDNNTDEKLLLWNSQKKYATSGEILAATPTGFSITLPEDNHTRFMMAMTPMLFIGTTRYNGKSCYVMKMGNQKEYIEKETGMVLYSKTQGSERKLTYDFDSVTEQDVKKPDISTYTLVEQE